MMGFSQDSRRRRSHREAESEWPWGFSHCRICKRGQKTPHQDTRLEPFRFSERTCWLCPGPPAPPRTAENRCPRSVWKGLRRLTPARLSASSPLAPPARSLTWPWPQAREKVNHSCTRGDVYATVAPCDSLHVLYSVGSDPLSHELHSSAQRGRLVVEKGLLQVHLSPHAAESARRLQAGRCRRGLTCSFCWDLLGVEASLSSAEVGVIFRMMPPLFAVLPDTNAARSFRNSPAFV